MTRFKDSDDELSDFVFAFDMACNEGAFDNYALARELADEYKIRGLQVPILGGQDPDDWWLAQQARDTNLP